MSKVKWKRTKDGIQFIEKKSLAERFQSISFMEAALAVFGLELVIFAVCLIRAVVTDGNAGILICILGYLAFFLSLLGIGVTCYGHYSVEAESKIPWKVGLYTNGTIAVLSVLIYIIGFIFG